jgi:hypothetical protein
MCTDSIFDLLILIFAFFHGLQLGNPSFSKSLETNIMEEYGITLNKLLLHLVKIID